MRRPAEWRGVLTERSGEPLPPRRAASRLSAYVYGNILVLAAVVSASSESIADGEAVWILLGVGVTTYVAHVFADIVAEASIPEAHGSSPGAETTDADREHFLAELRDAVPIMSSAVFPGLALALGWWGALPTDWAQLCAGAIVVGRIASVPIVTERVRGNKLGFALIVAGLAIAGLAAVIVLLKVFLAH